MPSYFHNVRVPDVGDDVAGKYRVDLVLGRGGMGIVYAATNKQTGKRVALKMLLPHVADDPSVTERLLREAQASARIAHRNIVDIFDVGESDGSIFLVMEFLTGMSLAEYIEKRGRLEVRETMAILTHVCRGVEAAHAKGVIHRDLKPDNVFLRVDEAGEALDTKVLDFGISKVADDGIVATTGTNQSMGTPFYMPPEQMTRARSVTPASDVYSLGVLTFHCLTGALPYEASTLAELVLKVHSEDPRPLSDFRQDVDPSLGKALARAMARAPADRYESVAAFVRALAPWGLGDASLPLPKFLPPVRQPSDEGYRQNVESLPTALMPAADAPAAVTGEGAKPAAESHSRAAPPRRMPIAAIAGVVALVGLVGVTSWASRRSSSAEPTRPDRDRVSAALAGRAATERSASRVGAPVSVDAGPARAFGASCDDANACAAGACSRGRCVETGFVHVASGTFVMGSPEAEPGRQVDERQIPMSVMHAFELAAVETTRREWARVMERPDAATDCPMCPISGITWVEALSYANARSRLAGLPECYDLSRCEDGAETRDPSCATFAGLTCEGYRLPLSAEWEYAARAGTTTATYAGDLHAFEGDRCPRDTTLDSIAWYCVDPGAAGAHTAATTETLASTLHPHEVGGLAPNAWGLYDTLGNVWEWTWDPYVEERSRQLLTMLTRFGGGAIEVAPPVASTVPDRVIRGGSYDRPAYKSRAGSYGRCPPHLRRANIGLRIARSMPPASP